MTIDPELALGLELPAETFTWTAEDVVRYHLTVGAGAGRDGPAELNYTAPDRLQVLPTFAMTMPSVFGIAAPGSYRPEPPEIVFPGIAIPLNTVLHARQELILHRPIPVDGTTCSRTTVARIRDKGHATVIDQECRTHLGDGTPLLFATASLYVRGTRTSDRANERRAHPEYRPHPQYRGNPERRGQVPAEDQDAPVSVVHTPTLPQQALLYQLNGERNPMHSDHRVARDAGYPQPILQGACLYGMVCKDLVDTFLAGDAGRVRRYAARFSGIVYPGETIKTSVRPSLDGLSFTSAVVDRDEAPALADGILESRDPAAL